MNSLWLESDEQFSLTISLSKVDFPVPELKYTNKIGCFSHHHLLLFFLKKVHKITLAYTHTKLTKCFITKIKKIVITKDSL